jgi:hypothetical protein
MQFRRGDAEDETSKSEMMMKFGPSNEFTYFRISVVQEIVAC